MNFGKVFRAANQAPIATAQCNRRIGFVAARCLLSRNSESEKTGRRGLCHTAAALLATGVWQCA